MAICASARVFGVDECSVHEWKKNEGKIQNITKMHTDITNWPISEEIIFQWILKNCENGLLIKRNRHIYLRYNRQNRIPVKAKILRQQ